MSIVRSSKNIFFFGNQGAFSASVLSQILQQSVPISRVFCASIAPASVPENTLPVINPKNGISLETLAHDHGIPINYIPNQSALSSIISDEAKHPDYILVACFPYRLPATIIDWPHSGCLNIHPSLLPKYRGPDPIFWQLHNNESQTGVTLHFVTSEMDAGPIVNQKSCPFEAGFNRRDIEITLAKTGASLFTAFINTGHTQNFSGKRQDDSHASYYPYPSVNNFEVPSSWSAKHAFNFIRGTHSPSGFYMAQYDNKSVKVTSALEYSYKNNISDYAQILKNERLIKFSQGILRVTIE